MKKIFSLFLGLVMVFALLPMTAFADGEITEVKLLGYETPVIGKTAGSMLNLTVPEGAHYRIDVQKWYKVEGSELKDVDSSEEFISGKHYKMGVEVIAEDGYVFASDTPAEILGKDGNNMLEFIGHPENEKYQTIRILALMYETPVAPTPYGVYVAGTEVTSANAEDVLGNGKVSYNPATNTLTLNGAQITHDNTAIRATDDLNIEVIGEVRIKTTSAYGISSYPKGNVTISGEGNLIINASGDGINLYGDATFNNSGNVSITSETSYGINLRGQLNINNGTVKVENQDTFAIAAKNGISIASTHAITEPVNGEVKLEGDYYYVMSDGSKAASVVIGAKTAVSYTIIVGANGEWTKGSTTGLSFTSDASFGKFESVKVDEKEIEAENYNAVSGSTKVTLTPTYLETLSVGEYNIEIVSADGSASTKFTVKEAVVTDPDDDTQGGTGTTPPPTDGSETKPEDKPEVKPEETTKPTEENKPADTTPTTPAPAAPAPAPRYTSPNTGDNTASLAMLAVVSGIALCGTAIKKRK